MRSLSRRFKNIQKRSPIDGDYCCLARAIRYQRFSKNIIAQWFNKLMTKGDYLTGEKKSLILHLISLSKEVKEAIK